MADNHIVAERQDWKNKLEFKTTKRRLKEGNLKAEFKK
jgi:hypothetical protein